MAVASGTAGEVKVMPVFWLDVALLLSDSVCL